MGRKKSGTERSRSGNGANLGFEDEEDDARGAIKVAMTGSAADKLERQQHIRNKPRRETLAKRFKNPDDPSDW